MEISTTNQSGAETAANPSAEYTISDLLKDAQFLRWAKFALPIPLLMAFALGCIIPLWFSGSGWISNSSMKHNVGSYAMPAIQFGSPTVYAEKGQTIEVEIDVHEVKKGGLYVKIRRHGFRIPYTDHARVILEEPGKRTLRRFIKKAGRYSIEFKRQDESQSLVGTAMGGQTDLRFSANWKVY